MDALTERLAHLLLKILSEGMIVTRIAIIGDVHGCITELTEMLELLKAERLDGIYHLGDLVDRGPDSGAVVSLVRRQNISGIMGNHESKLLDLIQKGSPSSIKDEDKRRSAESVSGDPENLNYLRSLPRIHFIAGVIEKPIVLVHAGLWPRIPLWKQPFAVMMAQLIDPNKPGSVAWLSDKEAKARGFVPWWEVWDGEETAVFGHTVFQEPQILGRAIGIDTGCVFGGSLTALILPDMRFVQVKAKREYASRENLFRDY